MRTFTSVIFFLFISLASNAAISCSKPPPIIKEGRVSWERTYNFSFVAVVVGEERTEAASHPITGLQFRVLESDASDPPEGAVVTLIRYSVGTMCERNAMQLTARDYPIGARVRVLSDDLFFAESIYYVD